VLERGTSPRIVRAEVEGSRGVSPITGPELRRRLGLYDTWATFTYISSNAKKKPADDTSSDDGATAPPSEADTSGGQAAFAARAAARPSRSVISGAIDRAAAGRRVRVQVRANGRWHTVRVTRTRAGGAYAASVPGAGSYRVVWGDIAGPMVNVR
jgi:stage II sporulation protein D